MNDDIPEVDLRNAESAGTSETVIRRELFGAERDDEYGRQNVMVSPSRSRALIRLEELVDSETTISNSGILRSLIRVAEHVEYMTEHLNELHEAFVGRAARIEASLLALAKQQDRDRKHGDE